MIHMTKRRSQFDRSSSLAARIRLILLILVLACFAGPSVLRASDEKLLKAEQILDKYVEATGGKAALSKITNQVAKSTLELVGQGLKLDITTYGARPAKLYSVVESEALGKIEKGTDGEVVWEMSMMMGPSIKEGAERAMFLREATFDRMLYWQKLYEKAECTAIETVDTKPCYKVVMTPKEGKPETFYFDQESHLIVKAEITYEGPMGTIPIESYASDYKKVDGILISHKARVVVMGQERIMTVNSVEHNVEMPSDRFKLPPEIQTLLEKEKSQKEQKPGSGQIPETQPSE